MERETGFEPATSTLARLHSTAELLPHIQKPKWREGNDSFGIPQNKIIPEWAEEDSNLQGFLHKLLRLARLPIPPSAPLAK